MSETVQPSLHQLVIEGSRLVAFSDTYHKLDTALRANDTDFDVLAEIINHDPLLAGRVMRLANSALFIGCPVDTITSAISRLGMRQLREITLIYCVIDATKKFNNGPLSLGDFWRHSLSVALISRNLAIHSRLASIERYYLTGLMSSIGRLVLFNLCPDHSAILLESLKHSGQPLHQLEHQQLGFNHCQLAEQLLRHWHLTEPQIKAIAYQYQTDDFDEVSVHLLHCAQWLSHLLNWGNCGENAAPTLNPVSWQKMNLSEASLEEILKRSYQQFEAISDLFLQGLND
ncbi:HDOD domain-containing protein [Pelagibaculum spongiae]|uniref:HDOD domain-containing protein n=1 Tax=Pelagibaculum spongiae TaxID=2080658 RepID=A0A2V1GRR9_9GAMM|nr:HDOD domain-containing protein [Pelagibaculum spongiae]PVZ65461.1 hypothetical protein DC094_18450 [Pelagibaculum spongiae]